MQGRGGPQMSFGPPYTPPVIKNLIIANVIVFVATVWSQSGVTNPVVAFGAVVPEEVWGHGHFWQPFTYMWLHADLMHILFNMFALWMFGSTLAMHWGEQRFLRYYLTCGFLAGVIIATVPYLGCIAGYDTVLNRMTLGASGAVFAVLLAFSFTWPERTIMLIFPPIPIKAIWLIPLIFFLEMLDSNPRVSSLGHLGGALVGWIYLLNEGRTPGAPTPQGLMHKWRRHQMRQKLRAVRTNEEQKRTRWRDDNDRLH